MHHKYRSGRIFELSVHMYSYILYYEYLWEIKIFFEITYFFNYENALSH